MLSNMILIFQISFIIVHLTSIIFVINIFTFITYYISFLVFNNWVMIDSNFITKLNVDPWIENLLQILFKFFQENKILNWNKVKINFINGIPHFS